MWRGPSACEVICPCEGCDHEVVHPGEGCEVVHGRGVVHPGEGCEVVGGPWA